MLIDIRLGLCGEKYLDLPSDELYKIIHDSDREKPIGKSRGMRKANAVEKQQHEKMMKDLAEKEKKIRRPRGIFKNETGK